jgi:DNA-binding MarR family transcriptional regulator
VTAVSPQHEPEPHEYAAFTAWRTFLRVHRVLTQQLDQALQDRAGMPLSWYDLLVHIDEAPHHRIRSRELEDRVLVSQSTVSRLAAKMEQAGLVTRTVPADDRRAVQIELTEAGRRSLRRARETAVEEIRRRFVSALHEDDAEHLLRILRMLRSH